MSEQSREGALHAEQDSARESVPYIFTVRHSVITMKEHATNAIARYEPFDPKVELVNLHISGDNSEIGIHVKDLTPEQKAERQARLGQNREDFARFKESVHLQQEGIQKTIAEIIDYARSYDGSDVVQLFDIVCRNAPLYRFSKKQLDTFLEVLGYYASAHQRVEKFFEQYGNNPSAAYERCFCRKPTGKVELEKGPMTLHFRCYDFDDYVCGHEGGFLSPEDHDQYDLYEEARQWAETSGGCTIPGAPAGDWALQGVITLENASKNCRINSEYKTYQESIESNGIVEVDFSQVEINIDDQGSMILHTRVGRFHIMLAQHYKRSLVHPDVVVFQETSDGNVEKARYSLDTMHGMLKNEKNKYLIRRTLRVPIFFSTDPKRGGFLFTFNRDMVVTIKNTSSSPIIVEYQKRFNDPVILDKRFSELVQGHEEQHQITRLFNPSEGDMSSEMIYADIALKADSIVQAKEMCIKQWLRWMKGQYRIHQSTRSEILSYYRDGKDIQTIASILSENSLYMYGQNTGPHVVAHVIIMDLQHDDPCILAKTGEVFDASMITEQEVVELFDEVFHQEHVANVKRWCMALTLLEQKGYSRDEIVYLLYQESARKWRSLALRAEQKPTAEF